METDLLAHGQMLVHALEQAIQHHERDEFEPAEALYRYVLQHDPRQADALHGLGLLASQRGQPVLATALIRQAIANRPEAAHLYQSLGNVLMAQGHTTAAVAAYQEGLCRQPDDAALYHNLGMAWQSQGQLDAARVAYEEALRLQPGDATTHYALGTVSQCRGDLGAARVHYERAIQWAPDLAEAHNNLGVVYKEQGEFEAALAAYTAALRLQPHCAEIYNNLGCLQQVQHNLAAARREFEMALHYEPQHVDALNNLGLVWQAQGNAEAALACFTRATTLAPDFARAQWNRALLWLARGDLAQGWPAYEWRWHIHTPLYTLPLPRWDGTALDSQTILVSAEQGIGDELLFASCLPDLVALARHVVVVCNPRLAPLFARSLPGVTVQAVEQGDISRLVQTSGIDVSLPMGSLPGYLRPTLSSFSGPAGYLRPDAARAAQYRQRLGALGPGLKVGIAWRSLRSRQGHPAYPPLRQWGPLLTLAGVHFVNLQYDDPAAELAAVQQQWGIRVHSWDDPDLFHDLDGVAALMAALDLVIAPDTAVAALAGSLGRPVWRLTIAEGTWDMLGAPGSPWFPSLRVVRQRQRGGWEEVFTQLAQELASMARHTR